MTSKRVYIALLGLIIVLIGALIGGAYGADSILQQQSKKLVDLKLKSQTLDSEQQGLATAKKQVQQYAGLEQIAKAVVPQDKDQAEAVREIVNLAASSNIKLSSINFPTSNLGSLVPSQGSVSTTPAPSTNTQSLSQLTPVVGISGVYNLQIIVTQDINHPVTYTQLTGFLEQLENNRRTAIVSGITITPSNAKVGYLTFTITLNEYIKP